MDQSDDDTILPLTLGLGFQDHLTTNSSTRPAQHQNIKPPPPPTLDHHHHQQHSPSFSFLTLALSEPKSRSDYDYHNHTTDDAVRRDKGGLGDDDIITKEDLNKGKTVVAAAAAVESSLTAVSDQDEEDYCTTPPKKKLRLSKHQISILENTFQLHPTLNPKDKNDLATQLNLRPRQVEVWFQNRRARIKMKQTEVDRESLKKCCEILREENRRLQKEVMELKSLKQLAMPFQFQLPPPSPNNSLAAPTLTAMCPSCEGTGRSSGSSSSLNPNNINGDDGSPTRSFFSSSTDSNNTPKTRLCK